MQAFLAKLVQLVGIPLVMELVEKLVSYIKKEIAIQKAKREIRQNQVDSNPNTDDFNKL